MHPAMDAASHTLGGKHEKPKKEIKEIRTRKAKSGGFVHEHHHTEPSHHGPEEHVSGDQAAMLQHMAQNMGEANPAEGQDAGADPAAGGAPAVAAGPVPGM